MTAEEIAAIRARTAGLLPIGYVVTALDPTYTHEQVDNVAQVLYTDVPALLAELDRLQDAALDPAYAALVANLVAYAFHWVTADATQRAGCEERLRTQVRAIHAWAAAQS